MYHASIMVVLLWLCIFFFFRVVDWHSYPDGFRWSPMHPANSSAIPGNSNYCTQWKKYGLEGISMDANGEKIIANGG